MSLKGVTNVVSRIYLHASLKQYHCILSLYHPLKLLVDAQIPRIGNVSSAVQPQLVIYVYDYSAAHATLSNMQSTTSAGLGYLLPSDWSQNSD